MTSSQPTPCTRLNAIIADAQAAGLVVQVESDPSEVCDFYSVNVRRPHNPAPNALAQYHNSQSIWILASRAKGAAAAFRLQATQRTMVGSTEIKPTAIKHYVQGMSD